jgi:hypothetical protein
MQNRFCMVNNMLSVVNRQFLVSLLTALARLILTYTEMDNLWVFFIQLAG